MSVFWLPKPNWSHSLYYLKVFRSLRLQIMEPYYVSGNFLEIYNKDGKNYVLENRHYPTRIYFLDEYFADIFNSSR